MTCARSRISSRAPAWARWSAGGRSRSSRSHGRVYALDNFDPASRANVLSRGLTGNLQGERVVASPIYKHHFALTSGRCMEDPDLQRDRLPDAGDRRPGVRRGAATGCGACAWWWRAMAWPACAPSRNCSSSASPTAFRITVFGAEPRGNYNRILLSPVLSGEQQADDIMLHRPNWYTRRGITLHSGDPIVEIDRKRRTVRSRNGAVATYDRLLIATGSDPIVLPLPGKDLPGVVTFRDLDDVNKMLERSGAGRRAVVIGGGLLGLEAAHGLRLRGMHVTVVHLLDTLMERQLDAPAGALLKAALEKRGIEFRMRAKTQAILGGERVTRCEVRQRRGSGGGPRGHGRRRAAEHRAGEEARISPATAASSSTTRCRPTTRPSTPSANACSIAARPSAWWRRCGSRRASARSTSPRSACRASRGAVNCHAAQGVRHRSVLRRRFLRAAQPRIAGALGQAPRRLQARGARGQQGLRRRVVRRRARSRRACAT